jgi:serine/threonine protein kinase
VDVWSCGCLIAELVTRYLIVGLRMRGNSPLYQLMRIISVLGPPGKEEEPPFSEMVNEAIQLPAPPYVGLSG